MSTAWRSVQRRIVRYALGHGEGPRGLVLARALAMATYRSAREFEERFAGPAEATPEGFRFPVENYLLARGESYAAVYQPEAFVCLSESIDLHRVEPAAIRVPTTLIGVRGRPAGAARRHARSCATSTAATAASPRSVPSTATTPSSRRPKCCATCSRARSTEHEPRHTIRPNDPRGARRARDRHAVRRRGAADPPDLDVLVRAASARSAPTTTRAPATRPATRSAARWPSSRAVQGRWSPAPAWRPWAWSRSCSGRGRSRVVPHDCYGGTYRLFNALRERGSLDVQFVDFQDSRGAGRRAGDAQPALVWVETPSNPLLRIVDIAGRGSRGPCGRCAGGGRQHLPVARLAAAAGARRGRGRCTRPPST